MHALAELLPGVMHSRAGMAAKRQILAQAQRFQATRGSYRCRCCGQRCEVEVEYDATGVITHSHGQCRTPGCLAWRE